MKDDAAGIRVDHRSREQIGSDLNRRISLKGHNREDRHSLLAKLTKEDQEVGLGRKRHISGGAVDPEPVALTSRTRPDRPQLARVHLRVGVGDQQAPLRDGGQEPAPGLQRGIVHLRRRRDRRGHVIVVLDCKRRSWGDRTETVEDLKAQTKQRSRLPLMRHRQEGQIGRSEGLVEITKVTVRKCLRKYLG